MLVVIDVQPRFPASHLVVDAVVKEIWKARRKKESIVVVKYGHRTKFLKPVYTALKGYRWISVAKNSDDGGVVIFDAISRSGNNLNLSYVNTHTIKSIKVCGVNTSACVLSTVRSLSYLRFPIKVLSHACANLYDNTSDKHNLWHHHGALKRMASWKNVEVV